MRRLLFFLCVIFSFSEIFATEVIHKEFEFLIESIKRDCQDNVHVEKVPGGLSNHNFLIRLDNQIFFLKIAGKPSIVMGNDIEREMLTTKIAASLGIAPKITYYSSNQQAIVSQYVVGQHPNTHDPKVIAKLMQKIRKLHDSQQTFPLEVTPFEFLKQIYETAKRIHADLPDIVENEILPFIYKMQQQQCPVALPHVPCHLDLHHKNIVDDGQDYWLIDWEFSAACDRYFDLALLSSSDNFTDAEMKKLLSLYNGEFDPIVFEHLYQLRIVADLSWGLWCLVYDKLSDIDFSQSGWSNSNFNSYREWSHLFLIRALERIEAFPL